MDIMYLPCLAYNGCGEKSSYFRLQVSVYKILLMSTSHVLRQLKRQRQCETAKNELGNRNVTHNNGHFQYQYNTSEKYNTNPKNCHI